jgi:hypothetical protein
MNIEISKEQREAFRDWLRAQLKERGFYVKRGEKPRQWMGNTSGLCG